MSSNSTFIGCSFPLFKALNYLDFFNGIREIRVLR